AAIRSQRGAGAHRVADSALAPRPTVVLPAPDEIDLLVGDFAHVAHPEKARLRVERKAPGVAKPPRPDLRARHSRHRRAPGIRDAGSGVAGADAHALERIVGRDAAIEVDAEDLAVGGGEAGAGVVADAAVGRRRRLPRVAARVACADVKLAVGTDG